jgi:hypothetical protein
MNVIIVVVGLRMILVGGMIAGIEFNIAIKNVWIMEEEKKYSKNLTKKRFAYIIVLQLFY